MDIWQSLGGQIRLRITCADIPGLMSVLSETGIYIHNVKFENDLQVLLTISRNQIHNAEKILLVKNCEYSVESKAGKYWVLAGLKRRYVLLLFLSLLLILTFWIPSRVWFIQVKGNQTVPSAKIMDVAIDNGLQFGSERKSIPIDKMKSALISKIPELNWVGITSEGCVVQIHISEKNKQAANKIDTYDLSHLVSNSDGIVEQVTVLNGTAVCKPGQAVNRGQLLISGYQDLGLYIRTVRAEGEIIAQTFHQIAVLTPKIYSYRSDFIYENKKISLIFGKKQINLYKGSGISPPGCVKMYSREYVRLPGGFYLPLAIVKEQTILYQTDTRAASDSELSFIYSIPSEYISKQMIAGSIISESNREAHSDDIFFYYADLICREQIGKTVFEELRNTNGKTD